MARVQAAPVLIRRIATSIDFTGILRFAPRRIPKSQLFKAEELERTVDALTRQIGRKQPLLILLDADDDCPANASRVLKERCEAAHRDVVVSIVFANKEYEVWFLTAAKSLASKGRLVEGLGPSAEPESIRGAQEWLTRHMAPGQSYSETRHQPAFSAEMDLSQARHSRSFRKLEKEVAHLLGVTHQPPPDL